MNTEKKCAKDGCEKAAYPGQKYCSRVHSPLGSIYTPKPASPPPPAQAEPAETPKSQAESAPEAFDGLFGAWLQKLREEAGIDRKKLRDISGAKFESTVKNIENGDYDQVLSIFLVSAKSFGASLDSLARQIKVKSRHAMRLERLKERERKRIAAAQERLKRLEEGLA